MRLRYKIKTFYEARSYSIARKCSLPRKFQTTVRLLQDFAMLPARLNSLPKKCPTWRGYINIINLLNLLIFMILLITFV